MSAPDPAAFVRCLEKGLGRAHLILQRDDPAPFRPALLSACVENVGYLHFDSADRAAYLFELIDLAGKPEFFLSGLIQALDNPVPGQSNWDRERVFMLLRRFAERGCSEAREAMYRTFSRLPYEAQTAVEIVRLDGEAGRLITESHLLQCGSEDLEYDRSELLAALRAPVAHDTNLSDTPPRNRPYAEIRRLIREGKPTALADWGERASEEDLRLAADDLLLESGPERLRDYLRIFADRPFPYGHNAILPMARHTVDHVSWAAVMALSQFTHPDIRTLAEEFAPHESRHTETIWLMARNARPEDWALLESWLDVEMDYSDYDVLTFAALDFINLETAVGERA